MKTVTRTPQSPESYGTFWESAVSEAVPATSVAPPADKTPGLPEATDAYSEFVNVTEGAPVALRAERS